MVTSPALFRAPPLLWAPHVISEKTTARSFNIWVMARRLIIVGVKHTNGAFHLLGCGLPHHDS